MRFPNLRTGLTVLAAGAALAAGASTAASAAVAPTATAARGVTAASQHSRPAVLPAGAGRLHTDATVEGCKAGYVCIYPGQSWNGGHPSLTYYTYGNHNLSDVTGYHYLLDNQTGGAWDFECSKYNGAGSTLDYGEAVSSADIYFTPVNSVRLESVESICTGSS